MVEPSQAFTELNGHNKAKINTLSRVFDAIQCLSMIQLLAFASELPYDFEAE